MSGANPATASPETSLFRRLVSSYAMLVVLIVLTGFSGAVALGTALSATDRLLREVEPARDANAEVMLDLTEVQSGVRGYLLTGDRAFLDGARRGRRAWAEDAPRLVALGRATGVGPAVRRERELGARFVARFLVPALEASRQPGGLEQLRRNRDHEAALAAFEAFRRAGDTVDRRLQQEAAQVQARTAGVRRTALGVLLGVVLVSVLVGSAVAASTSRTAVLPLSRLRRHVDELTAGDQRARADEVSGTAEVRALGRAINALSDERARFRAAEQDQVHARRLAHDVGLRIRERIVLDEVLREAVEEVGNAFAVDRVYLRLVDGSALGPVVAQWHEVDVEPLDEPQLTALAGQGSRERAEQLWHEVSVQTYSLGPDTSPVDGSDPALAEVAGTTGGRAVLDVAFGAGRDTLGTMTLIQLRAARIWSDAEVSALESVAADLGRAVQHATMYARERQLVEQLRELDRKKTDFLSTISHELRTPLTSITGYIELLRDDTASLAPAQSRMLDVIERNSYRLSSLIEDLLTLSRIESGAARAQQVPVDITSLVANACADVRPGAAEAGLALEVTEGPPGTQVVGDPGQLDRVLLNLLSNAVKFTPRGGRVDVGWAVVGHDVVVTVADTGIGIPENELAQLSSRFFRASNAMNAAIPGTGLGLTIVRGILEIHRGTLAIDSSPGGTTVTVTLPLRAGDVDAGPAWEPAGALVPGTAEEPSRL